ncbi:MAG TPA: PEP-CTERM sorting domain-containing protein, partial [Chthoniobacterales bacterium]|nr:PEP-CTERM sorting domain-containing protein [Chthoniobacterales bacterium]
AGNPFAMTPTGSSLYFSDGGGMGGSYFSGRNIELFTTSATNAGLVYTSSTDPFVATVEPVWTFTESFSDSSSTGSHFYTLQLTGTAAELFQSTSSTSLGTLIASGPETGAFPTNLPANPVPEPTTFGLLLSAGLSVIAVRKYRIRIR